MYMPYSKNPYLPKVRMQAVNLVYQGWSTRKVARYFGLGSGTVSKWRKKDCCYGLRPIPTLSSRPHSHPKALKKEIVDAIVKLRMERNRCAEVIHQELLNQGIIVSLSNVKRTLEHQGLIKSHCPWKRWHRTIARPEVQKPGDLIQIDTLHVVLPKTRFYVYCLLDVASRWAYAKITMRINALSSLRFVKEAQRSAPFSFSMIQTDHGSEFSCWFTEQVRKLGIAHRHSRVRQANDNGYIERFLRTLQEECLRKVYPVTPTSYQRAINAYLPYYNNQRLHLGLNFLTPLKCVQAIG